MPTVERRTPTAASNMHHTSGPAAVDTTAENMLHTSGPVVMDPDPLVEEPSTLIDNDSISMDVQSASPETLHYSADMLDASNSGNPRTEASEQMPPASTEPEHGLQRPTILDELKP